MESGEREGAEAWSLAPMALNVPGVGTQPRARLTYAAPRVLDLETRT